MRSETSISCTPRALLKEKSVKTNKLDIKKSRIYLQHPDAKWFLRKERKRQNTYFASLGTFLLGCLFLLAMFVAPTLKDPRWLPHVVLAVTLTSLFVASAYSERKPDPVMPDIWRLARELCVPSRCTVGKPCSGHRRSGHETDGQSGR